MSWTIHLEGGPRRVNHASVLIGEDIYCFGGYSTDENFLQKGPMDVYVLNTVNYRWSGLAIPPFNPSPYCPVPYSRYGHTAVEFENNIYLWGGKNHEVACNRLFCFNPETLTWSAPDVTGTIPAARDGHSACVINGEMYIFGGFEEQSYKFVRDVYAIDLSTMVWRHVPTHGEPPSYRDFHSANLIGDRMYVFGGRGDVCGPYHSQQELYSNSIMYLDINTNVWHQPSITGDEPEGRRSHSAFVYKNSLYIFGGYNGLRNVHFNDLYKFSPSSNTWQLMHPNGTIPSPRRRQSCTLVGDRVFLFGGTGPMVGQLPRRLAGAYYHGLLHPRLRDNSDLHVLDFAPSLRTLSAVAVINNGLDYQSLPEELKMEIDVMVTPNTASRPLEDTPFYLNAGSF